MKKIITLIVTSLAMLTISCKKKPITKEYLKPITKEYLVGKKFTEVSGVLGKLMGINILTFIDNEKLNYVVHDKRAFGYNGTYTLENKNGKQYIKISNIEKFGKDADWQDALRDYYKDYVMIEVNSPTKLKVIHSDMIFKLSERY